MSHNGSAAPADVGAMRLLTPERIAAAARLVRTGRVFDLGLELSNRIPHMDREVIVPFTVSSYRTPEDMARRYQMQGITFALETIIGGIHQGTHIDAFVHCQFEGKIYGGHDMAETRDDFGWNRHGAETIPPIFGRGVLLDVAGLKGEGILPDGYCISPDELRETMTAQRTEIREGDIVLVRTGKSRQYHRDKAAFEAGCPGISGSAARFLADAGTAVFGLDTTSADAQPCKDWSVSAHRELLVERGVHIIENVNLEGLAEARAHEFLFVCLPLRITGGTGSWVRPAALV
jgi:kynurenine formamidase